MLQLLLFTRWPTRNGSESTQLNPFDRKTGFNAWDVKTTWQGKTDVKRRVREFCFNIPLKSQRSPKSNLEATASLISASALTRFKNSTSKASVGWCRCLCDRLQLWEGKCILLWQWPLFYKPQALEKVVVLQSSLSNSPCLCSRTALNGLRRLYVKVRMP